MLSPLETLHGLEHEFVEKCKELLRLREEVIHLKEELSISEDGWKKAAGELAECRAKLQEAEARITELTTLLATSMENHDKTIEELQKAEAREERLREALQEIKNGRKPHVCAEYELCTHVGCRASYEAFAIADKALAGEVGDDQGK